MSLIVAIVGRQSRYAASRLLSELIKCSAKVHRNEDFPETDYSDLKL
jgi:hypothetical protein